jgi:hypothetical protein
MNNVGQGRIVSGPSLSDTLRYIVKTPPDFVQPDVQKNAWNYIHRRTDQADIYFVCNPHEAPAAATCVFRAQGAVQVWDAVTGRRYAADGRPHEAGRTRVELHLAARGSCFVVIGRPEASGEPLPRLPRTRAAAVLEGSWTVRFDPKLGGPGEVAFEKLTDWTQRGEPGIRHYSGRAVYQKRFDLPADLAAAKNLLLELGRVRNVAEVTLNGQRLGVVWTAPWQIDLSGAVRPKDNQLEIAVVNLWPNRLIGDAGLPADKRLTATNVKKFKPDSPLLPSGLLGPVRLIVAE